MSKPKPCTLGPKHKWTFVKNVTRTRHAGQSVHISFDGLYKCECGQRKYGRAQEEKTQ